MPVAKFYSSGCVLEAETIERFLDSASDIYAKILDCPKDRVRVYLIPMASEHVAIEGEIPGPPSFYFEFIVLEGRSLEQRQQIARGFCELIGSAFSVDSRKVRGHCIRVNPEDWCIGGQFASELRKSEIEARKNQLKR